MPGLGVRLWNPMHRAGSGEVAATSVNTTVFDPTGLNGTTIPFICTGNVLVRIVGRAQNAPRPLNITVKWQGRNLSSQGFYAESGSGGCFAGIWSIIGQPVETGVITITSGEQTGCAAIRCGEIGGAPAVMWTNAMAGYSLPRVLANNVILIAGGCTSATASPFISPDLQSQYIATIPAKTDLPNRHNGLSAFFGFSNIAAADGNYDIVPAAAVAGVIAGAELKL